MNVPVLETERLTLRGFREDDLDEMAAISADPEVTKWVGDDDGLRIKRPNIVSDN